jgi:Tfp pilus assembly protein PilV
VNLSCHRAFTRLGPVLDVERHLRACVRRPLSDGRQRAFSLIEVMIAMAVFFMAIFAILDLTTQNIASARRLQSSHVDASSVAASLSLTNFVEEGPLPPDIVAQFHEQYPGYHCAGEIYEVSTNGLFQVDLVVSRGKGNKATDSSMSLLLYRPGRPGSGNRLRR